MASGRQKVDEGSFTIRVILLVSAFFKKRRTNSGRNADFAWEKQRKATDLGKVRDFIQVRKNLNLELVLFWSWSGTPPAPRLFQLMQLPVLELLLITTKLLRTSFTRQEPHQPEQSNCSDWQIRHGKYQ